MEKGVIVELVDRGHGYIKRTGIKDRLFFHADDLVDIAFKNLSEGDTVTFLIIQSNKGPYATRVERIS